jgi:glycolate oxidase FAD binding subunit
MADIERPLQQQVADASNQGTPLRLVAGGSRAFLPSSSARQTLELSDHSGILQYHPEELVITLRAGTTLDEIDQTLQSHQQQLAFEPPRFTAASTIGGTVATALAGPARPWQGGVRDHLLGAKVLSGDGSILRFGGEVVKNVAGYDLFRPLAGSYGTLGVLLELSFKVLPSPPQEQYWQLACGELEGLEQMQRINRLNLPLSGLCWYQEMLHLRLCGPLAELAHYRDTLQQLGLQQVAEIRFWQQLRDLQLPLFDTTDPLWRISLPGNCAPLQLQCSGIECETLLDWGGAQRFVRGILPHRRLRSEVAQLGGHATLLCNSTPQVERLHPLPAALQRINQQMRLLMDPAGILNPGIFPTT